MPITSLRFTNVGPFDDIEFEFDPQVNVLVGPNNSGKSTVLWVLSEIVVYPFAFPLKLLKSQGASWEGFFALVDGARSLAGSLPIDEATMQQSIRPLLQRIGYTTFVPALRRSTDFRAEGPVARPTARRTAREERESLYRENDRRIVTGRLSTTQLSFFEERERRLRETRGLPPPEDAELTKRHALIATDAFLVSNQAVVQKIIELDYTAYRRRQPGIRRVVERIASIASEITEGFPVQFLGVAEDEDGLFPQFRTPDGDLPLNVFSQGTQSIIQWLAYLLIGYAEYYNYPPNLEEKPGILIIDEIDAHLHPSWQRRIIPTLIKHFPNLQIFCSTHSPLMLAGLKAGQVQLLRRDEKGKVTVSRNEDDIKGWSADEILRNFLDVPNPTDLATVGHIERLAELRRKETLSEEETAELERLRHDVSSNLLGGPIAGQLEQLTALLERAKAEMLPNASAESRPKAKTTRRRRKPSS